MDSLLTLAEMDAHTQMLVEREGDRVEVRALGRSAGGRAIDLISLGDGPRSALIVGSPHPNEPIGCLVIQRLIDRFADRRFLEKSGYRWHFIKSVDPDGIALNEGWFKQEWTLAGYLGNFYRPAIHLQGEYSFPIDRHGYRFDAATPENRCWQKALELTRPDLQCSLHNADAGGVFYLLSGDLPDLGETLASQPADFGLPLNLMGEPELELERLAPGVFKDVSIADAIDGWVAQGASPAEKWSAGAASTEYAFAHYGTFSMVCEVPLARDTRVEDVSPSALTKADLAGTVRAFRDDCSDMMKRHFPGLEKQAATFDERCLTEALRESSGAGLSAPPAPEEDSTSLSVRDAAWIDVWGRSVALRTIAMLGRLADAIHGRLPTPQTLAASREAWAFVSDQVAQLEREGGFQPYPVDRLAAIQERAILTAADALHKTPWVGGRDGR